MNKCLYYHDNKLDDFVKFVEIYLYVILCTLAKKGTEVSDIHHISCIIIFHPIYYILAVRLPFSAKVTQTSYIV